MITITKHGKIRITGVVLKATELTAACRWQRALQQAAAGEGAGWLKAGWRLLGMAVEPVTDWDVYGYRFLEVVYIYIYI